MKIVGCDLHTRYQQIAMLDEETGELVERRLEHGNGEAKEFYTHLAGPARIGIEATGHMRWFEQLLAELGHELWIGDAARIRAAEVRKQKTDAHDAALLLELLLSGKRHAARESFSESCSSARLLKRVQAAGRLAPTMVLSETRGQICTELELHGVRKTGNL
jgi:transposase